MPICRYCGSSFSHYLVINRVVLGKSCPKLCRTTVAPQDKLIKGRAVLVQLREHLIGSDSGHIDHLNAVGVLYAMQRDFDEVWFKVGSVRSLQPSVKITLNIFAFLVAETSEKLVSNISGVLRMKCLCSAADGVYVRVAAGCRRNPMVHEGISTTRHQSAPLRCRLVARANGNYEWPLQIGQATYLISEMTSRSCRQPYVVTKCTGNVVNTTYTQPLPQLCISIVMNTCVGNHRLWGSGPVTPETIPKALGLQAPQLLECSGATGAVQTPTIDGFRDKC